MTAIDLWLKKSPVAKEYEESDSLREAERRFGVPRRDFMKFAAALVASMGLPSSALGAVVNAMTQSKRPSVIWLQFQECTGCTESLLRSEHPTLDKLILDLISLDYHETLAAAAGHQVEAARKTAMETNKGKYILVVEGAIPMKDNGIYCNRLTVFITQSHLAFCIGTQPWQYAAFTQLSLLFY